MEEFGFLVLDENRWVNKSVFEKAQEYRNSNLTYVNSLTIDEWERRELEKLEGWD